MLLLLRLIGQTSDEANTCARHAKKKLFQLQPAELTSHYAGAVAPPSSVSRHGSAAHQRELQEAPPISISLPDGQQLGAASPLLRAGDARSMLSPRFSLHLMPIITGSIISALLSEGAMTFI